MSLTVNMMNAKKKSSSKNKINIHERNVLTVLQAILKQLCHMNAANEIARRKEQQDKALQMTREREQKDDTIGLLIFILIMCIMWSIFIGIVVGVSLR